jgi:hypothetical protein
MKPVSLPSDTITLSPVTADIRGGELSIADRHTI